MDALLMFKAKLKEFILKTQQVNIHLLGLNCNAR